MKIMKTHEVTDMRRTRGACWSMAHTDGTLAIVYWNRKEVAQIYAGPIRSLAEACCQVLELSKAHEVVKRRRGGGAR